jgi:hypothetical protein
MSLPEGGYLLVGSKIIAPGGFNCRFLSVA